MILATFFYRSRVFGSDIASASNLSEESASFLKIFLIVDAQNEQISWLDVRSTLQTTHGYLESALELVLALLDFTIEWTEIRNDY